LETEKEPSSRARSSPSLLALFGILASYVAFVAGAVMVRRSPRTPNQHAVDSVQEQDSTDRNSRIRANANRPPAISVTEHQVAEPTGEQDNSQRRRKKIRRLRKAGLTWISIGTFVVILTYTVITNHLWDTTQESVHQLRRQIAMEHRAWLLLDTDYSDTFAASDKVIKIPIRLTNIGKSPAEHIEGTVEIDEVPRDKIASYDFAPGKSRNEMNAALIYPGFPHTTEAYEWASKDNPVKVDSLKHALFAKGDIVFVIQGRVSYDDVFHIRHWFEFCHAISASPASHAQGCVDKNRIDPFDE
jgi:hypothetical protein